MSQCSSSLGLYFQSPKDTNRNPHRLYYPYSATLPAYHNLLLVFLPLALASLGSFIQLSEAKPRDLHSVAGSSSSGNPLPHLHRHSSRHSIPVKEKSAREQSDSNGGPGPPASTAPVAAPVPRPTGGVLRLLKFFNWIRWNSRGHAYKNFRDIMVNCGYHLRLANILDVYPVTILAPNNTAITNVTANKNSIQRVSFHVLLGKWPAARLASMNASSQVLTADIFPDGRIYVYKVNLAPMKFAGRPDSGTAGTVIFPNMYVRDSIIAHGLDTFLEPYRYFSVV